MLYYALVFLLIGFGSRRLGLFGVAAIASQISWILFLVGIILLWCTRLGARNPGSLGGFPKEGLPAGVRH